MKDPYWNYLIENILQEPLENFDKTSFSDSHIEKVFSYISDRTSFMLDDLLALSIVKRYLSLDKLDKIDLFFENYIKEHSFDIIKLLDENIIQLSFYNNNEILKRYKNILHSNFNGKTIGLLDEMICYHFDYSSCKLYSIRFLLENLLHYGFEHFDQWLNQTKREDLKLILLEQIINNPFRPLSEEKYSGSRNPFIKVLYIVSCYRDRFINEDNFNKIFNSKLTDKEKLISLLFYFVKKYSCRKYSDLKESKDFQDNLSFIKETKCLSCLELKDLDDFKLNSSSFLSFYFLFNALHDETTKKELFALLFDKIIENNFQNINPLRDIEYSEIITLMLPELGEEKIEYIEKLFKKKIFEIRFPYAIERNYRKWTSDLEKSLFLLFVLCKFHSNNKDTFLKDFQESRTHKHFNDEKIDECIKHLTY